MKSFQQSASVGANFGGSVKDMISSATGAGLTIDAFSAIIAKNGESVALLGQGSADGAKRLGELGKRMRQSGVADELYRMGYSTEDINNGMAGFAGRLAKGGALQKMTTEQIASVTGNYLKELNAVSVLTGKSKDALQEQEAARMADAQYLNLKNKLDADGQKNLELLMASIPEGMQAGAKEVIATGTATTKAGEEFLVFMKQSGRSLQDLGHTARKTGTITTDAVIRNADLMQAEGTKLQKSSLGDVASRFIPEYNNLMVSANQLGSRQTKLSSAIQEQIVAEEARKKKEQELKDRGLDPASMERFKQQIAEVGNRFTEVLTKHMPDLVRAFSLIATIADKVVIPMFVFLADHIKMVVASFIALKVAQFAYNQARKLEEAKSRMRGTYSDPMYVRDVARGKPTGGGSSGGKGKMLGRLGGGLAAVTSVVGMVSELGDIGDELKAGRISEEQANKQKAEIGRAHV
jgi:hypothetical protein